MRVLYKSYTQSRWCIVIVLMWSDSFSFSRQKSKHASYLSRCKMCALHKAESGRTLGYHNVKISKLPVLQGEVQVAYWSSHFRWPTILENSMYTISLYILYMYTLYIVQKLPKCFEKYKYLFIFYEFFGLKFGISISKNKHVSFQHVFPFWRWKKLS